MEHSLPAFCLTDTHLTRICAHASQSFLLQSMAFDFAALCFCRETPATLCLGGWHDSQWLLSCLPDPGPENHRTRPKPFGPLYSTQALVTLKSQVGSHWLGLSVSGRCIRDRFAGCVRNCLAVAIPSTTMQAYHETKACAHMELGNPGLGSEAPLHSRRHPLRGLVRSLFMPYAGMLQLILNPTQYS